MTTPGRSALGTSALAGGFARATPTVVAIGPSGTIDTSPFTVTWTYSSPLSRAQAFYRIRVLSLDDTVVIFDTGYVAGAGLSAVLNVALSAGSSYHLEVSASDGFDWAPESVLTFTYDGDLAAITPLATVGRVYEVGINGVGYMLADRPEGEIRYERRVVPLDPPRLATGDTPFSEAIERYQMLGHSDWSDGAGQRFYRRNSSSERAFYTSEGVNPFEPGELRLLPGTTDVREDGYPYSLAVVAGGQLYVSSASGQLAKHTDPTDVAGTTFPVTGCGNSLDMTSDGAYWYVADGANVYRNKTAADPGSAWSTVDAMLIEWCSDRIAVAYKGGASTKPNVLATLNYSTGAVAGPGAGSTPFTFEEETEIVSITSGDGWMFWATVRFDKSVIYAWQLGSTDSYITSFELPAGRTVKAIGYYQGNVFIRSAHPTDSTGNYMTTIYQGAANNGALTVTQVAQFAENASSTGSTFSGDGRFVYFSWRGMSAAGWTGVGAIDLSTGGWAKWLEAPLSSAVVSSIVQWYGRTVLNMQGDMVKIENEPGDPNDGSISSGYLITSVDDLNSSTRKRYTNVLVQFDPLPTGATVTVSYSLDAGASWVALSPVAEGDGTKTAEWDLDVSSDSIQVRLDLTHGSTTTPIVRSITVRANAIGLADQVLVLPIMCSDIGTDLRQQLLPENGPGAGARRARTLENLCQSSVLVQDVDYQTSGTTQVYDLVAAETRSVGVMDRKQARQTQAMVTVLTLRRSLR